MTKKALKLVAKILVVVFLCIVLWVANGFFGNPVSAVLARHSVKEYVQQVYGRMDLHTERFGFNFKTGGYFAYMQSQSSQDTAFYIHMDMLGRVTYDSYDSLVTGKHNTELRVQEQYRFLTDGVLDSADFTYESNIKGGMLDFAQDREVGDDRDYSYAISRDELVIDKLYSLEEIRSFGARAGILTIYVMEDEVTVQRAAEIMLSIRELFDDANVPFYRMDFVLRYPMPQDGSVWPEEDVRAELLYGDIREEGLTGRIQESHKMIYEKFAEMDKEKPVETRRND